MVHLEGAPMSRFLFVVPPFTGHVNPTVAVAAALVARGHEVAWAGHADGVGPLLPDGARLFSLGLAAEVLAPTLARARDARGLESLRVLWQDVLVPLARAMRPRLADVLASFQPDVLAVDEQAVAGALAARAARLPWATLTTTSATVTDPLAALPKVKAWVDQQLAALEADAGLPPVPAPDRSPTRVIVFSTEALVGPATALSPHYRFVGPSLGRSDATPFPWDALASDRPRVLVSLGTVSHDRCGDFYQTCAAALGDGPWQVILVAPDGRLPAPPANFLVRPRVPQLALLPHCRAVICHAGHNTVAEALAHGLPLVVAPIRDDQPVIADQVVRAGAGVRLRFGRLAPAALREAVAHVLDDPAFTAAARRVQASFAAAGGAPAAARLLEELAP
jgi:MGT family glycosyltransferase